MQEFAQFRLEGDQTLKQRQLLLMQHSQKLKQEIQRLNQELDIVDYKIEFYAEKMLELEWTLAVSIYDSPYEWEKNDADYRLLCHRWIKN